MKITFSHSPRISFISIIMNDATKSCLFRLLFCIYFCLEARLEVFF